MSAVMIINISLFLVAVMTLNVSDALREQRKTDFRFLSSWELILV